MPRKTNNLVLAESVWGAIANVSGTWELRQYNSARDQIKGVLRNHIEPYLMTLLTDNEVERLMEDILNDPKFMYWTREMIIKFDGLYDLRKAFVELDVVGDAIPYES